MIALDRDALDNGPARVRRRLGWPHCDLDSMRELGRGVGPLRPGKPTIGQCTASTFLLDLLCTKQPPSFEANFSTILCVVVA